MSYGEYSVCVCVCSEINAGETAESSLIVHGCRDHNSRIDHLEHVQVLTFVLVKLVFTALHGMQTRSCDENSVCPSNA